MSSVNKIPPHSREAEQSFLGAILIDPEAMHKVADHVDEEMFYFDKHAAIYAAMMGLYARHEPIDLLSLGNRLEEMGKLEHIGGRSYLAELTNVVPTASNVAHYGDIVQKKSTLRKLVSASSKIAELGFQDSADDVVRILDEAETTLFAVAKKHLKKTFVLGITKLGSCDLGRASIGGKDLPRPLHRSQRRGAPQGAGGHL